MSSFGQYAPADIRLPNRKSARESSPGFNNELTDIRQQLANLQRDVVADVNTEAAQTDLEDEVTQLYHELQRCTTHLEHEKVQRKRVEAELEGLRGNRLKDTADVVQDLERKRTELTTLREERAMMKEWLDRGVSECKRVADDVSRLKGDLDVSEKSCTALAKDKQRLALTVQELSEELSHVQLTLEKAHHEKSLLELKAEESVSGLGRAEEQRRHSVAEADRLSAEVIRLSQKVRGLEDAEISMQSMCSCIDALCKEVSLLESGVSKGDLEDPTLHRVPLTEAANDIGSAKPLPVMVVEAKRLLQHLQDSLSRLRGSTKRYICETNRRVGEQYRSQNTEVDNLHRDREMLMQAHAAEAEQLRRRVVDLEQEIVHVASGVQRDISNEASNKLDTLDRLSQVNREAQKENEFLKTENARLKQKASKMKIDWSKVDESRRRYQQLQVEVQLMKEYNEKIGQENRNLKLLLEARQDATRRGSDATHSYDMDNAARAHRNAFDEWRNETIRTSNTSTFHGMSPR